MNMPTKGDRVQERKTGKLGTVTGASGYGINIRMDGPDIVVCNYRLLVHFERDFAPAPTNPLSERQSFAAVPRPAYRVVYKRYAHGVLSACPNGPAIETWLTESRDSAEERASDQSAWDYEFGIDARWTVERAK